MKILFVNTNIGYGGASKMMVWVANQCANNGHEVFFFTYRESIERQTLNPKVNHVHEQLENISGKGKNLIACICFLHEYINKENFDLAISFLPPSHIRLAIASIGTKCMTLFSERGDPSLKAKTLRGKILNWCMKRLFCSADAFVFQTPMAAKCFSQIVQDRSEVISNPIKPLIRTKERAIGGDKNIVCVARLDIRQKRQDLLIDAFNLISEHYSEYTLQLFGDGFEYDEKILREKAEGNSRIHFMGPTKDVAGVIQCATMVILSSDFEGIPNALLESMSLGIPAVATDCTPGGAAMLIRNYENGILVPRNDAKALAEAMEYVITHSEEAEHMGKMGMEVNKIYAESVIANKWLKFIEELKK